MKTEPLRLAHAARLKEKLQQIGNGLSEYCFANLYLFRQVHEYAVVFDGHRLLGIIGKTYDGIICLTPLFDVTRAGSADLVRLIRHFGCLYPVSRADFEMLDTGLFVGDHNPDDSDYVYAAEKLRSYPGRKLAAKRNLMKQFLAEHRVASQPYRAELRGDAETVLDQWQQENGNPPEATDYYPALEALTLTRELALSGYVYYADDGPAGFLLAGENAPGMCAIHFAKASRRCKGIFPYMFNHFVNTRGEDYVFYNFEQDLGKPNFRKNKQSYDPDRLLVKYRVKLKP